MTTPDLVVRNIGQLLTMAGGSGPRRGTDQSDIGRIDAAALAIGDGRVVWTGPEADLPPVMSVDSVDTLDADGKVVIPAFVDCHTHIPFAGGREREFEMRNAGRSYLEIAESGGGILNSAKHFRAMSTADLLSLNRLRLARMVAAGSVTIECKTGYALDREHELRALEIIQSLDADGPWKLVPTFLGAHAVPHEFADDRVGYIDLLVHDLIPEIARRNLAVYCDIFIEQGAFTVNEGRTILRAALDHGLVPKLHVDEFTSLGGTALAAELGAISADHLETVTPDDIGRLAKSDTIAVLMPGVNYFLANHTYAPARAMITAGVPVAVATDFNPGSCMCHSMTMMLSLACTQLKMTAEEAMVAATRNAAYGCGRGETVGRLESGWAADLLLTSVSDYRELPYHFAESHVHRVVADGRVVATNPLLGSQPI